MKYLQEYIFYEIIVGVRRWKFAYFYRSPSQTHDEFETFLQSFELTLDYICEKKYIFELA